ncbi:IS110 family transposase [Micromonospora inyonensis]|uniref:Transposase n=1 Tax=Micromonospora inyonensis TaxID=47866 RepID=A0A1C6S6L6_9ACTN|nr:IS110 family transposase [Micromonospora inyonensis]SCL24925.1 Transposase [Micromonospora inyonensis]
MDTLVQRCAGLDIGKADLKACVRIPGGRGRRHQEIRTFATTTPALLELRDWLSANEVTVVGMEATGDYWKPVCYLLEDAFDVQLLNARHMRNVPGRKTDVADSAWIARLIEHGLVRPSFVPPPRIRRLRDLTRYRTTLVQERTREIQWLEKVLEDAGIKLSTVASHTLGISGRAMIDALIAGERDPQVLAALARARMRAKIPALRDALVGRFTDHHAFICRTMLDRIDAAAATIDAFSARIEDEIRPFQTIVARLDTIPGVNARTAQVLIAEIGVDMSRFPTPGHLASWAGMCPGNHESAGKHHGGATRKGDSWLRGALGEAGAGAARSKDTYLQARYRRIASRRGKKRALVAVGHSILTAIWHMISNDTDYNDLGAAYFLTRTDPARQARRLLGQLHQLGYQAVITPIT